LDTCAEVAVEAVEGGVADFGESRSQSSETRMRNYRTGPATGVQR